MQVHKLTLGTLALATALVSCGNAHEQTLAGHRFEFPPELEIKGPKPSNSPDFDDDLGFWVDWPMQQLGSPLQYVEPSGFSDGPGIQIYDINDAAFTSSKSLNDPEIGYNYVLHSESEIGGLSKYVHSGERYTSLRYFDEQDRDIIGCHLDQNEAGECYVNVVSDTLMIQYLLDSKHLEKVPEVNAHLVDLVSSWIVRD